MHEASVFVRRLSQKLRNIWWRRRMATLYSMDALVKRRTVTTASISFEGGLIHLKEGPRLVVVDCKERVIPHLPTDSLNSKSELNRTDRYFNCYYCWTLSYPIQYHYHIS
ncbi:hypothetical protein HOLleu_02175 [Holothuria leucospilota]|uniref:Uncharacterized protein n=1 Tax=Holothuria leucospilota TaxID=206669 RepID=A0A9Q1CS05_HOLLE|nr:hypothetical protein HOLleu_02175 [Holothuria leucospilota]